MASVSFYPALCKPLAGLLAVAALAGCASMAKAPEETVRTRATDSWKARIANDLDTAYQFMPPSFRTVTPVQSYKNGFSGAVTWLSAEVVSVKCETPDKCLAYMKVEAKPLVATARRNPPISTYFDETWIREDGQWWLFPTP
jgi:hypothetical protein